MAQESDEVEETLASRLMSRASPGLHRRTMADGGQVVSGPLARQALSALNARAFTMDHTIFVDDDFDPSNPDDAALYAHERHHQLESGGLDDGHSSHDGEEVAARAIERMVLHRSARGDSLSDIMSDVRSGRVPSNSQEADQQAGESGDGDEDTEVQRAYRALIASGRSHEDVVRDLTTFVLDALAGMEEEQSFRSADASLF
ncbi:MAG: hypothetical protein ACI9K2_002579 [Myxococcota bacterium]|jgi:hypothetical protein